jgi:hypothetical protein
MRIKNDIASRQLLYCRLNCSSNDRIEDPWFEIVKNNKKYEVEGVYRHPNRSVERFTESLEVLVKITTQGKPCRTIIAGDINIDLTKRTFDTKLLNILTCCYLITLYHFLSCLLALLLDQLA